jgi:phosphoribosylformylglycinamidine synthase
VFGEDQARYVIGVSDKDTALVLANAKTAGVPAEVIGITRGRDLVLPSGEAIAVAKLRTVHESWLPDYMGAGVA